MPRYGRRDRRSAICAARSAGSAPIAVEIGTRVVTLQREVVDAADKLKRLCRMAEDGGAELDDILRDRIASLKLDRGRAQTALDRIQAQTIPATAVPPEMIEKFGREMCENIANGEVPFRKAYLRAVIDRIEVDDHVVRVI